MQNSLAQVVLNVGWLLHTFIIIHHHVTFTFNLLKLFSVPLFSETSVVTDFGECFLHHKLTLSGTDYLLTVGIVLDKLLQPSKDSIKPVHSQLLLILPTYYLVTACYWPAYCFASCRLSSSVTLPVGGQAGHASQ